MAEQAGFLDGAVSVIGQFGQVVNGVAQITDTGANIAEDIARGRGALHQEADEHAANELEMFLDREKFLRGDNIRAMQTMGAVAVAVVVLLVVMK